LREDLQAALKARAARISDEDLDVLVAYHVLTAHYLVWLVISGQLQGAVGNALREDTLELLNQELRQAPLYFSKYYYGKLGRSSLHRICFSRQLGLFVLHCLPSSCSQTVHGSATTVL
jgi:hypothetical protein